MKENGFFVPRNGEIDTNIVYFGLPENTKVSREEFVTRLDLEYGIKLTSGYSSGGKLFRIVTHMDVDDEGIDRAIQGISSFL